MNSKNITFSSSYDEKALSKSVNSSSLHDNVFLSYCKVTHCYLSNKSNLYCLITMSFSNSVSRLIAHINDTQQKSILAENTQHRIIIMTTKCILCDAIVHPLRIKAGINTCIHCGDKLAKQRKHCIVPMHKSNYIVVTNHDDLVRINNKSG